MSAVQNSFLDWAREGERLCKAQRYAEGSEAFMKALEVGTDDVAPLSAVYCQLGNALFAQRKYDKALEYHLYDMTVARLYKDIAGEAKACGNVGNVFKTKGSFNDAMTFTEKQIELARQTGDKRTESLGYYNLASVYHLKGKQTAKILKAAVGGDMSLLSLNTDFSQELMDNLSQAITYYKISLQLADELNDRISAGRTYGSLGNTFYLMRDYENAVHYHELRLGVGKEFGDKGAMRRAYSNLGNAYVFMSRIDKAIEYYQLALVLASDLRDKTSEAQACFSLANAATLVSDYHTAATYHGRHLSLARKLADKAGEARAYSSLSIDYRNIGDLPKAAYFLARHRKLAREMKDCIMLDKVEMSLRDLIMEGGPSLSVNDRELLLDGSADPDDSSCRMRLSLSLHSLTEDMDCGMSRRTSFVSDSELSARPHSKRTAPTSQEEFFEFLSRLQSKRMDEQRCDASVLTDMTNKQKRQADAMSARSDDSFTSQVDKKHRLSFFGRMTSSVFKPLSTSTPQTRKMNTSSGSLNFFRTPSFSRFGSIRSKKSPSNSVTSFLSAPQSSGFHFRVPELPMKNVNSQRLLVPSVAEKNNPEAFMEILMQAQGRRMDEQRANLLPGLQNGDDIISKLQSSNAESEGFLDEKLIDWLSRVQSQRMDEQRSELGGRSATETATDTPLNERAPTIPEDDIGDLVMKMQAGRIEEQRAHLVANEEKQ